MKAKKPPLYYLGTFLMVAALAILIYTYYPIAQLYLFPPKNETLPRDTRFAIIIPKIHAESPIIPNVDASNETIYRAALKHGVALAKGFALPNQQGITYLFAHSSDYPWNITRDNVAFFKLYELTKGDTVDIFYQGRKYVYRVSDIKTVWPTDTKAVTESKHKLVLQTCTPIGTDWQRLLVYADPIK